MKLLLRTAAPILVCAAALLQPAAALAAEPSAADRETARTLVIEGRKKFGAGDYEGARKAFEAAHEIMGVPTTGLDLARALEKLGKLVEARATALEVTRIPAKKREPQAFTEARPEAQELAEKLEARIPALELKIEGPPADALEVKVDGEAVPASALSFPRKVNPGSHTVEASAAGWKSASREVSADEGQTIPVELTLEALPKELAPAQPAPDGPTPPPETSRDTPVWAWVAGGVGLAALGVGGYFAYDYISVRGDVEDACPGDVCTPGTYSADEVEGLRSRWNRDLGLAIGLGAAGLAGVGVAIVGIVTAPEKTEAAEAGFTPWASPTGFGATYRGAF